MVRDKWQITWGEFKAKVESQGVTDNLKICWIDMDGEHDPEVKIGDYKSEVIGVNSEKQCTISSGHYRPEKDVERELKKPKHRKKR
jgi:hypothetical protein